MESEQEQVHRNVDVKEGEPLSLVMITPELMQLEETELAAYKCF